MAWWLAYEELYGDMDKEYPIMSEKFKDDITILGGNDTISFTGMSTSIGAADTISFDSNYWWDDDGSSLTGNPYASPDTLNIGTHLPGGMGEDHITFNVPDYYGDDPYPTLGAVDSFFTASSKDTYSWEDIEKPKPNLKGPGHRKYQEDKGIKDLSDYVTSTYQGHYTNDNSDVQTLDLIHSVGDAESFCRSNAIKYLSRYDKKGQAKRDILKSMHYCLLLYYFSGQTNDEITTHGYETF